MVSGSDYVEQELGLGAVGDVGGSSAAEAANSMNVRGVTAVGASCDPRAARFFHVLT